MKNIRNLLLAGALLVFTFQNSTAQNDLLHRILDQLTDTQRTDFFDNLGNFDLDSLGVGLNGSGVVDSLNGTVLNGLPFSGIDSLNFEWGAGRDSLVETIMALGNDSLNLDSILNLYDDINTTWLSNLDSLSNQFGNYQDSLSSNNTVDDPPAQSFDSLLVRLPSDADSLYTGSFGGDRLQGIVDQLFNKNTFTYLELAYGKTSANLQFYDEVNDRLEEIDIIRIASVPTFETIFESRWHGSASFYTSKSTNPDTGVEEKTGFKPFIFNFDYAIMYNPGFTFGGISFRYLTGLGFEASVLSPSFAATQPATMGYNRLGNTFGYGPQLSTGFSATEGNITTYALASTAIGSVVCFDFLDHAYTSRKFEAGIRYADAINLRYALNLQSWTADLDASTGKNVRTTSEVTVGVILDELFK